MRIGAGGEVLTESHTEGFTEKHETLIEAFIGVFAHAKKIRARTKKVNSDWKQIAKNAMKRGIK